MIYKIQVKQEKKIVFLVQKVFDCYTQVLMQHRTIS